MLSEYKQKFLEFYEKHETRLEIAFFLGGFIFDVVFLSEVDDLFALGQQAAYLIIIAIFLHYEILFRTLKWRPEGKIIHVWAYRDLIVHFLLGSLLSVYSLFYIKSSSFINSILFLFIMVAILLANELPVVKKAKVSVKVGLFVVCLFSFIAILIPLGLGFIGTIPFALSLVATLVVIYLQIIWLQKSIKDQKVFMEALVIPGASVLLVFSIFYWMGWIPPVPLSTKDQGIYHLVEKKEGSYFLSTEKEWWKFWQSADQDFKAEPNDKIYFFAQIYSPARISDDVLIHWFWKDPKGNWKSSDRIPLKVVGGRLEGFRGFATKANYQPGDWRVQIETSYGQEISRLNFTVTTVAKNDNRTFQIIKH